MSSEEKKSEIQTLIRRRSAFKGRLTKFADFLELLAGAAAPPQEADGIELETRTITLESAFSEFEQYQDRIEGLVEDEDVQIQFQERDSVESRYFPLVARAKQIIAKQSDLPRRPSSQGGSEHGSRVDDESDVKLPPIKIPQFSGAYEEWMPFCDMFTSLVHEKPGLSSIRKFHYLRGALSGRAARAVQGLEITTENYEAAWNLLKKRYKNENLIIHNHIKAIVEHPKMAKGSITSLTDLVDAVQAHLRSLQALKQPVKKWDTLLIYLIADKLDADTKHDWESEYLENDDSPTMSNFTDFLEKRCRLLEKTHRHEKSTASRGPTEVKGKQQNKTTSNVASTGERKANCVVCGGEHPLFSCSTFNEMTVQSRIDQVKKHKLCLNCLRSGHICVNCKSSHCRKCGKTHNTLLHFENSTDTKDQQPKPLVQQTTKKESEQTDVSPSVNAYSGRNKGDHRVLPTAIAQVLDRNGKLQDCTMLLDCGSQSNFMTMDLCRRLSLKTSKVSIPVTGIFQTKSSVLETAIATIRSKRSSFEATLSVLLVPQITDTLPSEPINLETLKLPVGIKLADPNFNIPKKIDMLLGVDVFWDIVTATNDEHPFLHETKLGFVVSGSIPRIIGTTAKTICNLSTIDLSQQLEKFWETENCPASRQLSTEERECELHFVANCSRDKCGRFIVSVPFKGSVDALGDSLDQATKRFLSLERKLNGNQSLKNRYTDFMDQYQKMGHMTNVEETVANPNSYYLPHHGVIKESSSTTKLRVVFDGSAPTTTGVSINDLHMVGPTIQKDLLSILLRFRKYVYAVSADVQMMYRQILVNSNQRPYQRILWRTERSQPIETFELNTVTYGLASSSFLAIRCLFHLADSCESSRPDVAKAIRESMYVDDFLGGADTKEDAVTLCEGIAQVLRSGCFALRKWISNEPEILLNAKLSVDESDIVQFTDADTAKTLGLSWTCGTDELIYKIDNNLTAEVISKRHILSVLARIFDPLGLLSPCIVVAKILLQNLWLSKSGWDEPVSPEIQSAWIGFSHGLPCLNDLRIPRQCCYSSESIEMHGFSDASEKAFGGCVYLRSKDPAGNILIRLLCAKTKVAPLKILTIPRLELNAAQILSRLVNKAKESLDIRISRIVYWCDSTITLGWINKEPNVLKTFVSNRVVEILSLSNPKDWRHVPTKDNPADLLSRGVSPQALLDSNLWWQVPAWLSKDDSFWPASPAPVTELPEVKPAIEPCLLAQANGELIDFTKFSNLSKLERIMAMCLRFIFNASTTPQNRIVGPISAMELRKATSQLAQLSQRETFSEEIKLLNNKKPLQTKSKLLSLNPFIDTIGALRVGGRLEHSGCHGDKKHPIVISSQHCFTKLLFAREHLRLLHPGPQLLLATIRERFWPISGKNLAKKTVHNCVVCFRANPKSAAPLMGNLPHARVNPAPAFHVTGVDYAGPFLVKDRKGRGSKTSKCYIALFVCFTTRAIHLELVSDLTTDAFVLALRRFASRRGMPKQIYSDNGTNFVGAKTELAELGRFLLESADDLANALAQDRFNWSFIPPSSPHFGGIWEAGVKSAKHHLKRVAGNASLTFEEFYSLLVQIEAILNSRPLTPLSSHPSDLQPLTPAHFLVGRPLTSVPDPDVTHISESRLSRYQRLQQIQQHFWHRWGKEYLSELQCRSKWQSNPANLKPGTMVIIREDNLPPMKWRLGRIEALHPGTDSIARVASIRTIKGIIRRSIVKLCPLPLESHQE